MNMLPMKVERYLLKQYFNKTSKLQGGIGLLRLIYKNYNV